MADLFSPPNHGPVLVIGAAGIDLVGRLKGSPEMGQSNPAKIRTSWGGSGRNVAENLGRLGQPVQFITAVGTDHAGDELLLRLSEAGVDISPVLRTSEHPTGAYAAAINAHGELQVAMDDMRALSALTPAYLEECEPLFRQAALLFVDANLSRPALRAAITLAQRAGLLICADPASRILAEKLRPHLGALHLLTANRAEAEALTGVPVENSRRLATAAAQRLVSQGVKIAIVTLAHLGLCYATSQTHGQIPAIRTAVADPTGAGAALAAAVIFALLNDIPLDDAVRLGVSAASLTLRHMGAVNPDLTLEKLYDELVI